jgi:hypothetical protein
VKAKPSKLAYLAMALTAAQKQKAYRERLKQKQRATERRLAELERLVAAKKAKARKK